MSNDQAIANTSKYDTPTFSILSEGKEIDPGFQVFSIAVTRAVNRIPFARIALRDGDVAEGSFTVTDDQAFKPGSKIDIQAGYDGDNDTIFKGIVVKQKIRVGENGNSLLYVDCRDEAFKATLGRKNQYFEEMKDSEVMEKLLGAHGVKGKVEATKVKHQELVQYYCTDWDFILSRAEANGLLVLTNDGKVDVAAPKTSGKEKVELAFGGNVLEFEAEIDARYQWKKVEAQSWDSAQQKNFKGDASSVQYDENGDLSGKVLAGIAAPDTFDLRHGGRLPEDELKAWSEACLLKSRLAKIRGRARFVGLTDLKPGDLVKLSGAGERFNGLVYVTGVRHELVDGSIYMDVQFGLEPRWFFQEPDVAAPIAAGVLPGIQGLQIGKVLALEGDPEKEERIQVNLPVVDPTLAKGVWARLASLDAGPNRGWVIRPEIDDEVIVGFLNGDPRDAVVLGMLHSSKNAAPIPAKDDNHIKGYTSRSEMKMEFDDENKIIVIETPAGNKITITEKDTAIEIVDQNKNEFKMNKDGILAKSSKDIKIEAPGNIEIKAAGDLKMEGMNVNAKAQTQLKAEGGAGAELSSGGQTVVKGSMVMIN